MHQQTLSHSETSAPRLNKDVYTRVTDRIIADLEKGVRPWMKPWSAEHAGQRITRPLRPQRRALFGNQHPDALGIKHGARIFVLVLDDV